MVTRVCSDRLLDVPRPRILRLHVTIQERSVSKPSEPLSSRDKVRAYRERLRQQGLRPFQIWVPDVRAPGFEREARRQALAVAQSRHARDDQDFIDAVSALSGP